MLRTLGLYHQKQWDSKSRFHDPLRHPQRFLAWPVFRTTIRAALRTLVIGLPILLPEVQCGRVLGVAGVGWWPVCLPLFPEAPMAWNIAHLAKGSLSVPPPDRVEAASCFSCPGGQGGTLSQLRVWKCSVILVRGEGPVVETEGEKSIYFLDRLAAATTANTLVRQFRKPGCAIQASNATCDSVTASPASKVTFALNLFWATD